jgi:hypothetical protein
MTRTAVGVAVAAVLAASAVHAEVVTLSCSVTMRVFVPNQPTAPAQMVQSVVIDLDAGTVKGPGGTVNIERQNPTTITWMDPYETTMCQSGSVDRVTGEYQNIIWKHSCQQIQAAFKGARMDVADI